MFWEINYYWGGKLPQFNSENFSEQTVSSIIAALEKGRELYYRDLHMKEISIARLNRDFIAANSDPKKGKPIDIEDLYIFDNQKDDFEDIEITPIVANTFFYSLKFARGRSWILAEAPIQKLERTRESKFEGDVSIANTPCLEADDIFLIAPIIKEDRIYAPLAILNNIKSSLKIIIRDPRSKQEYRILLNPGLFDFRGIVNNWWFDRW